MYLLVLLLATLLALARPSQPENQVVDVTHRNIDSVLSKQPLLLEFYAPWCSHCKTFEPSYKIVATKLAPHGFTTARVDIEANPAIAARFAVQSIPSFFLYRDNKMYLKDGLASVDKLVEYCMHSYSSKGALSRLGGSLVDLMTLLSAHYGLPTYLAYLLIALAVAVVTLTVTFGGIYYSVMHMKIE